NRAWSGFFRVRGSLWNTAAVRWLAGRSIRTTLGVVRRRRIVGGGDHRDRSRERLGHLIYCPRSSWSWRGRDIPHRHQGDGDLVARRLTAQELAELPPPSEPRPVPWGPLFKKIAPVTAVDFCYGWTLWVYLTWLPPYLATAYDLPIKKFVWFTAGV